MVPLRQYVTHGARRDNRRESAVRSPAGPGFLPRGTEESSYSVRPQIDQRAGPPPAPTSNLTRQSTQPRTSPRNHLCLQSVELPRECHLEAGYTTSQTSFCETGLFTEQPLRSKTTECSGQVCPLVCFKILYPSAIDNPP